MKNNQFNIEISRLTKNINCGLIYEYIHNALETGNKTTKHNSEIWIKVTLEELTYVYTFLTKSQIRYAIQKLVDEKIITRKNIEESYYKTSLIKPTSKGKSLYNTSPARFLFPQSQLKL